MLIVGDRPVLFASRPILTSDASGPNRGTVIFAKYFDKAEIKNLSRLTKRELLIVRPDESFHMHKEEIFDLTAETGRDVHVEIVELIISGDTF